MRERREKTGRRRRRLLRRRVAGLQRQIAGMFAGNGAVKLFIDPRSGAIVAANPAAARFYGYSVEELTQLRITDLNQLPAELVHREMDRAREEERTFFEFMHRLKSGALRHVEVYTGPCQVKGRELLFSIIFDITERVRLGQELAQTQRMEALGRLAGGVAHDFNNLLTTIEMLRALIDRKVSRGLAVEGELGELRGAVARGAAFTGQLLAFCRRRPVAPVLIDLARVVRELGPILRRLAGERIVTAIRAADCAPVVADRAQLEQMILDLAMNASAAMPRGGRMTVAVEGGVLDAAAAARLGMAGGEAVELRVEDTGAGIEPELRERIFEPFVASTFGRGDGLGLATVYGVARQSGGAVAVESGPGAGSAFRVWLPRARVEPAPLPLRPEAAGLAGGSETVLVAEDEDTSRHAIVELLAEVGYHVLEARDGQAALEVARRHSGPLHLLLSDVVMPVMGGPELAKSLVRERPDTRVLYMSGYVDSPIVDHGLLDASQHLLAKPFSLDDLLGAVRRVLDAPARDRRRRG